ncbi:putative Flagellar biosynthetic protein FlhF, GTP binding [Nitrospira sp. KM1]|uniref:flagellar biosynthesis protein FlhF n=1 Tax=Nitrospira sp. KM1 TaxID=1936990 RepID=UPI0013A7A62C|nr:flagellar biosynthesis protein FlhF [Nitrospira sp. KM1]BCA54800.1 putative Flagellar biosynthetic protein FlhF, GTP binding [Nitrospira sp. KM1]
MHVKVFHAYTMQEAIHAIKAELGPDAVILSTKDVRQRGVITKWFGRQLIEVTAAVDRPSPRSEAARVPPALSGSIQRDVVADPSVVPQSRFEQTLRGLVPDDPAPKLTPSRPAAPPPPGAKSPRPHVGGSLQMSRVRAELRGLHQHLLAAYQEDAIETPGHIPVPMTTLYRDLIGRSLAPQTAALFVQRVYDRLPDDQRQDVHRIRPVMRELTRQEMKDGTPLQTADGERTIVVFFGPAGVGKTTTIAKLATRYRSEGRRTVALMTLDTYRHAAVEQLRGYANTLEIQMETALTKQDAVQSINRLSGADVILIDTGGRNAVDPDLLNEIRWLTTLDYVVETHLVLSATTREEDLLATVRRCGECPVRRLLFTKLDEASGVGSLLTVHQRTGIPFSYFGTGPRVPYDLEVASGSRLADLLLDGTLREEGMAPDRIMRIVSESIGFEPVKMSV